MAFEAVAGKPPILVLAVGNPSRGDDAVGPLLAEQLCTWLARHPDIAPWVEVICEQQWMVEHALDLPGRSRVLMVDARLADTSPAIGLVSVAPRPSAWPVNSHHSSPGQLLALCNTLLDTAPPPASLLTLTGHDFSLGAGLSVATQAHMHEAWQAMEEWLLAALANLGIPPPTHSEDLP
jgi:hydrogenase maturation protease